MVCYNITEDIKIDDVSEYSSNVGEGTLNCHHWYSYSIFLH